MKKRMLALLLLASLTAGLCAAAAGLENVNPEGDVIQPAIPGADPEAAPPEEGPASGTGQTTPPGGGSTAVPPPAAGQGTPGAGTPASTAQAIGFSALDNTVRKNNLTLQSLDQTMRGLESTDVETQFFMQEVALDQAVAAYKQQVNMLDEVIAGIERVDPGAGEETDPNIAALRGAMLAMLGSDKAMAEASLSSAEKNLKDMDDQKDKAQEQVDDAVYTTRKTVENTANTLVSGAESLYINIAAQQLTLADLQSQLAALDRKIAVSEVTYRQGNLSQLDLEQLKNGRAQTMSGIQSLAFGIDSMKSQLGLLLGWEPGVKPAVTGLPPVTAAQLRSMNYENDLKAVLKNSYAVWQKKDAVRQADNDYEDDVTSTLHAVNAAKLDQQSAERSVTQSFRTICDTVVEKQRLAGVAQTNFELQTKLYDAEEKKYELGKISKNDLADARDTLAKAKNAVTAAQYELFTAFNQYEWAPKGLVGS